MLPIWTTNALNMCTVIFVFHETKLSLAVGPFIFRLSVPNVFLMKWERRGSAHLIPGRAGEQLPLLKNVMDCCDLKV